ncbi:hypothetical protein HHI36_008378 [Cryptolaemus montrouzieri]|uniref:Uncharacterized protein n=1 Tax=Cryptolaemus montrouzieri TaxID=559131 RepID=A0ABD2MSF0_9CUCU
MEWTDVAKIVVNSWSVEKYFSVKLVSVFVKSCFNLPIEDNELVRNFLSYISETEANLIKSVREDFVDSQDLLGLAANFDSKWKPIKLNFSKLILDIAHKEMIQKPAFII